MYKKILLTILICLILVSLYVILFNKLINIKFEWFISIISTLAFIESFTIKSK